MTPTKSARADGPESTIFANGIERYQWLGNLFVISQLDELKTFLHTLTCRYCQQKVGSETAVRSGGLGMVSCRACATTMGEPVPPLPEEVSSYPAKAPHSWVLDEKAPIKPIPSWDTKEAREESWQARSDCAFEERFQAFKKRYEAGEIGEDETE